MIFTEPATRSVFEEYEQRAAMESQLMRELPLKEGLPRRDEFLLPVGRDAGAFLHSLIRAKRPALVLELGTSYGYSTLFLADAVAKSGGRLVSMELADYKQEHAQAMIDKAGLTGVVDFRLGDAVQMIGEIREPIDFVLLDIWKELYVQCFNAFYPKLADEGLIAADNMVEPKHERSQVREYRTAIRLKADLHTALLPIGSGIELTSRWIAGNSKL